MGNMSYCRFRNTYGDMEDCLEAIRYNNELSDEEFRACKRMFRSILDFCEDYGFVEVDEDALERFFEKEICKEDDDYEDDEY